MQDHSNQENPLGAQFRIALLQLDFTVFTVLNFEAACKKKQRRWPATPNIVGCYMLRSFTPLPPPPPVACFMPIIGSCCAKFETGQPFSYAQTDATTPNVAYVCTGLKATLSFLSYQNFSPSHNFEQHRKPVCTNHCMASKQSTKTTFSNSANLQQKETKMLTSVLIVGGKVRCKKWAKLKNTPNCLVTYCKAVRLMCFTNGHTIVFLPQTKRYENITHMADSVEVAIGIGIKHWQDIVWWSSISLQCVPYARIPNCQ